MLVKWVGLMPSSSRGEFTDPEYDLEDIRNAINTDSYIKMALYKYDTLICKPGITIKGVNQNAAEYIESRLRIMSFCCNKPFKILIQEIAQDLNHFHNAFLIKSRIDKIYGSIQAKGVLDNKPIGGYFRVDPWTMKAKRDNNGKITNYEQEIDGETKTYKNTDVIHFYLDKDASNVFGTPRIVPALEDVKLLRKLESNVLVLIYRFSMPIYQWIVGLAQEGKGASNSEIKELKKEIEKMTMEGNIVTSERVAIKTVGAEGQALDACGYLNYFEKRVFTALGSSESQMGRGGAKKDADSMEQLAHDIVKNIQRTISIFVDEFIITELLLEGGFNPLENKDDIVNFAFEEINTETTIKKENNIVNKFNSNLITIDEARLAMGIVSQPDEGRLCANMFETQSNGVAETVSSINNPSNQHGKTSAKVKESLESNNINRSKYSNIYNRWSDMLTEIRNSSDKHSIIPIYKKDIKECLMLEIKKSMNNGVIKAYNDCNENENMPKYSSKLFEDYVNSVLSNILANILKDYNIQTAEKQEEKLINLIEYIIPKSYWYGYIKACSKLDIKTVVVKFNNEKEKVEHKEIVNTNYFEMSDIPAFHSFCKCELAINREEKEGGDKN